MPRSYVLFLAALLALAAAAVLAQAPRAHVVVQSRGADGRVDYASLTRFGPWDDRNYALTEEDLALLVPGEAAIREPIPAFYRVELRRRLPLRTHGPAQYPHSALPQFFNQYGGYLIEGRLYRAAERVGDRYVVRLENGLTEEEHAEQRARALDGESRVTNPIGAAESAVAFNPTDPMRVIAGTNGPSGGQRMHFSTDGGETWTQVNLPLGGTCCDPTIGYSSDGSLAYTATLSGQINAVWVYRSADDGETWDDFETLTPGDPRREFGTTGSDKEFLHVDTYPTSPHIDNIYITWHIGNILQFARSTDFGDTWQTQSFAGTPAGIASDITTDKEGNIYYLWPSFTTQRIWSRKSTDGGATFAPVVEVAETEGIFNFPLPSQETREVAIVLSADTDLSDGPFANSVYAAWTDSTGPTTDAVPADNHGRIQVAYSRDGGDTWTVTTPHETADANEVDRWQSWIEVGPDGTVYVLFYDTRLDPSRTSVDLFYSVSTDGAVTWSAPERLTTVTSPNITTSSFEFGDYSGLDIVMNRLIGIFTDNRDEGGGGAQSRDVYTVGREAGVPVIFIDGFESGDVSAW